ncbi:hypothetical protein GS485_17425 [Rhodococcus hoagii]|nr:hypothetical protein [Prescottella equi]
MRQRPAGAELTTSFTDKQIRLKELQWAIDEADQKRNEVYDDRMRPTRTVSGPMLIWFGR